MYGISDSSGMHIIQGVGSIKSCARSTRTRKGTIRGYLNLGLTAYVTGEGVLNLEKSYLAGLEGFLERPTLKETSLVLQQHWPWERWQPTEVGERRDVDFSMDLSDFWKIYFFGINLPAQARGV